MAAWRYEISLLVLKKYFSTLEEKFRFSARPRNILYECIRQKYIYFSEYSVEGQETTVKTFYFFAGKKKDNKGTIHHNEQRN